MRHVFIALAVAGAAACTSPPPSEPEPPAPVPAPVVSVAAESPEPVEQHDPRDASPPSVASPSGEGTFLVVRRQSAEPLASNGFILDDGDEMVANVATDDRRAAEQIYETLQLAGMSLSGSGGHGMEGIYVPHEHAERARRLLERLPGAQVYVRAPDETFHIAYEIAALPADESTEPSELVFGLLRPREGNEDRISGLLRAAAIPASVLPRHGTLSFYVPPGLAEDARWLLRQLPGAVVAPRDGSLPDVNLVVFPSAVARDWGGRDTEHEHVAAFDDDDEVSFAKVHVVLDRLGIPAIGISNAGGSSVSVPGGVAAKARRALWALPGAELQWKEGDPRRDEGELGRFTVFGWSEEPRDMIRAREVPHVVVAQFAAGAAGDPERWNLPWSLVVAGFNVAGASTWDEDGQRTIRLTVPEAEADAARRLLALLRQGGR